MRETKSAGLAQPCTRASAGRLTPSADRREAGDTPGPTGERALREVLVSLPPERAERIFAGLQTYEIRKTLPRLPARVCFFDPARKVLTGEAELFEAIALAPRPGELVFKGLLAEACITEAQLRRTAGDGFVFGWHLEHVRKYPEPRPYKGPTPLPWQYLPLSKI